MGGMTPAAPPTGLTAEQALARYRETRDPRDIAALFDLTSPDLFRVALHLCPDAAMAEDALQETFLAVMEHPDRYEPGRPARPWLNAILQHHASKARWRRGRVPDAERLPTPASPPDPALSAESAEEREHLREAMDRLPEPYRGVALLRWRYGLEPAEIADVKGVPPGTVWSLLHRAVKRLKAEMGAIPALLLAFRPERGIAGVKGALLRRAAAKAVASTAASTAAGTAATVATVGGIAMAGKGVVVVSGAVVAAAIGWLLLSPSGPASPTEASPAGKGAPSEEPPPPPAVPPPAPPSTPPRSSPPPARPPGGPGVHDPASATATLRVRTTLQGEPPRMRPIKFDAEAHCSAAHGEPVLDEAIVAKDGKLANAIVYVSKGIEGWTFAPPGEPVLLDQRGCMYDPHVFTVMVGQPIAVRNSDPLMHNVHALPKNNDDFNKSQPRGSGDLTMKFFKEEVAVRIRCDVHGWMQTWAGVFRHPFHEVTDGEGMATLRLPPGDYEITAWQESDKLLRPAPQKVTLPGNEIRDLEFVFEVK